MARFAPSSEHRTPALGTPAAARGGLFTSTLRRLTGAALASGVALGCSADPGGGPPRQVQSVCGNSICEAVESCASCAEDCGTCAALSCGNDVCEAADSCGSCAADCGACSCGNGKCDEQESCADCNQECGVCVSSCGDGKCEASECGTCPADCGACPAVCGASCQPYCGDGVCVPGKEDCSTCATDCGACAVCGDGTCEETESCSSCSADCCPNCGNGTCDEGERCDNCAGDCGACSCGDGFCSPGESCADDCASDVEICGNGKCEAGESCSDCAEDCTPCVSYEPDKLVIYTVNYENLLTPAAADASCKGQWTELLDVIAKQHTAPDALLVQQISGKNVAGGIQVLQQQLMQRFPGETYKALVAEDDPTPLAGAACPGQEKQTNGILFREKRLYLLPGTKTTLMAKRADGESCTPSTASRNLGVFARFGDLMGGKSSSGGYLREVAIASVHWPSDPSCGAVNAQETHERLMAGGEAYVTVWGGGIDLADSNAQSSVATDDDVTPAPWYSLVNAELDAPDSLGYTDAVWESCDGEGWGPCLEENSTFGGERHDYLFFKLSPQASEEAGVGEVVTFDADPDDNGIPYSKHRAISAEIFP